MREKGQKCVSEERVETHNREKKVKNVCPRQEWRQIMREKGQKCVSKARVETDNEGKRSKMCVRGESGDT
ncbi:hypothetical protein FOA22_10965 [Heyndrickxia oleronia]